jgi:hypothetical protein
MYSNVIYYDEFLTGCKNEALYISFKLLIIKFSWIPALLIPLATLYGIGYEPEKNNVAQIQNTQVIIYCRMYTVGIPCILSIISYIFKLKYRLSDNIQIEMIHEGIESHIKGLPCVDPISGLKFSLPHLNDLELDIFQLFGFFPSLENAVDYKACLEAFRPHIGVKLISNLLRDESIILFDK